MNEPIRLLHLSDIHFRGRAQWDADPVLRALNHYLADEVRNGLEPDLVVISGDLAYAGRKGEYTLARAWLGELWPVLARDRATPLPRERLLLVPGNHDVDRDQIDAAARFVQDGLLNARDQDQIADILASRDQRQILLKRHAAYLKFHTDWLGIPQPLPWWQRRIDISGQSVHVAGLDSAWMACGDTDRGRLLLGRYQVHQTVLHPDGDAADWRLALLHHPWDYLAELDSRWAPEAIRLHRDLVLRGHLHQPDACRILPPDPRRACLELAAGSVYDGSPYDNAFQWIELYPCPRRARVHFRFWNRGAWQPDYNQPGDDDRDGAVDLSLDWPATVIDATLTVRAPDVPAARLEWPRRTNAGFKPVGQDAPEDRATRSSQVYASALTTPAAPGPAGDASLAVVKDTSSPLATFVRAIFERTGADVGGPDSEPYLKAAQTLEQAIGALQSSEFPSGIEALDRKDVGTLRLFPITLPEGVSCLGVTVKTQQGWPPFTTVVVRRGSLEVHTPPIAVTGNEPYQVSAYFIRDEPTEREYISAHMQHHPSDPARVPVPQSYVDVALRDAKAFLKPVVSAIEEVVTNPNTTVGQAKILFAGALGDQGHRAAELVDREFPSARDGELLNLAAGDKSGLIQRWTAEAYLIKQEALAAVVDLSDCEVPSPSGVWEKGPRRIAFILEAFVLAIEATKEDAPESHGGVLHFVRSPYQDLARWLRGGILDPSKPLSLAPGTGAYTLASGMLCFDVDKTLLAKGKTLADVEYRPIRNALAQLLALGVRIAIISGNYSATQKERVLDPLRNRLETVFTPRAAGALQRLDVFAGTGSVRLRFDGDDFALDQDYDSGRVMGAWGTGPADIDELLADDGLLAFVKSCLQGMGVWQDEWVCQRLRDSVFPSAEETPTVSGAYLIRRDGLSMALRLVGLGSANGEDHRDGVMQCLRWAADQTMKGPPPAKCTPRSRREIYRKFRYTKAGISSIDITLRHISKATAALCLLREAKGAFAEEDFVYFGDEFLQQGNDYAMRDARLQEATLVHIGDEPAARPLCDLVRVNPDTRIVAEIPAATVGRRLGILFDGPDGKELDRQARMNRQRSYSLAVLYFGYPLFAVSWFPGSGHWIESSFSPPIQGPRTKTSAKYYVPLSSRDRADEKRFLEDLCEALKQLTRETDDRPGGRAVDELLSGELCLLRQGKIPLQKMAYHAHAYLRGASVLFVAADAKPAYANAFDRILDILAQPLRERGPSVYAFFPGAKAGEALMALLNERRGERGPQF